ncbi:NAD(P)/FAD-dependent oxidoreductase [Afifella pfennigii]|uniref:NAD(P)/FAD-dependent oxidoreductase n=1 Tax=Afifella pfennigii TaxID=209897 RepID=UPI00047A581D|nr:FAD-dependent oxidoreductase [Afifella pfennigii]
MSGTLRPAEPGRRMAVIGSGIAGLSAAWLLSQRHEVVLYEAESRPGGHSNTVELPEKGLSVDTGFIVYNELNYPNLVALFAHLGVATEPSDMSLAVSLHGGRVEYCGSGLNGLIGRRGNIVSPRFWAMLKDLTRFYREAPSLLGAGRTESLTLAEYLEEGRYGAAFVEDHLLPMAGAIWSASPAEIGAFPALAFVRFFHSHGLLLLSGRPPWRTVSGGSRRYVERIVADSGAELRGGTKVAEVTRKEDGVTVRDEAGHADFFDAAVIATHADQALALLGDADPVEWTSLSAFRYSANRAVLHQDEALMPTRRRVWSSWNVIDDRLKGERWGDDGRGGEDRPLSVTYWMNRLQNLPPAHPLFVSLNPPRPVRADRTIAAFDYTHPVFDQAAIAAQADLWRLQGRRRTYFAGSYFGYGFHEDALQAGLAAAEAAGGVRRPWKVADESGRISLSPHLLAAE